MSLTPNGWVYPQTGAAAWIVAFDDAESPSWIVEAAGGPPSVLQGGACVPPGQFAGVTIATRSQYPLPGDVAAAEAASRAAGYTPPLAAVSQAHCSY